MRRVTALLATAVLLAFGSPVDARPSDLQAKRTLALEGPGLKRAELQIPPEVKPEASAKPRYVTPFVTMAEDLAGNAPEGFDLTALKVRRVGKEIEFRFELDGLTESKRFPQSGTVWWYFNTEDKSADWWVVADIDTPERYYVMWSCCYVSGGGYADSWEVKGEYNWRERYVSVFVPISTFGGSGATLSHCHPDPWFCDGAEPDVLVHSHLGSHHHVTVTTTETDSMMTTRSYVIPKKRRN